MPSLGPDRLANPGSKNGTSNRIDWKDERQVIGFVEERWSDRDRTRQSLERQWFVNIAQYMGYQYHVFDNQTGNLITPPSIPGRSRVVFNRLMPAVRKFVSKALKERPIWSVTPATGDMDDQARALVGKKLLEYYWKWLGMDRKMVDAFTWLGTTGNVFLRAAWDPHAGAELGFSPEELEPFVGEYGPFMKKVGGSLNLGDLDVRVRPPFSVDVDPVATSLEDAAWLIDTQMFHPDYLEDRYGVRITPDSEDSALTNFYLKRIKQLAGPYAGFMQESNEDDVVMGHELWVNPTKKFPKGYHCFIAGGKALTPRDSRDLPNPFLRIPYVHLFDIQIPGRFWGSCPLEHSIPIQAEYNRWRNQLIENGNKMANPKLLLPNSAQVSDAAFTTSVGEKIGFNGVTPPAYLSPPSMPEYNMKRGEWALKDIEDTMSVHEVTQARAPGGVRAASAIALLQEQDEQTYAPTFMLAGVQLSKIGNWLLNLAHKNMTEDRVMKVTGKGGKVETMVFTGSLLVGKNAGMPGVNYFDVDTSMGSQIPSSPMQRKQWMIELINAQVLHPVTDRKKIIQMLKLGSEEPFLSEGQADTQNAEEANLLMMQGIPQPVHPSDDPAIHLEALRNFQKTPYYRENETPEIAQLFEMRAQELTDIQLAAQGVVMDMPQGEEEPMEEPGGQPTPDVPAPELTMQA